MLISDIYKNATSPVISFEVFPPRTDEAMDNLIDILPLLADMDPAFMTVTYGAMGVTQDRTLEIATLLKDGFGMEVACHLTCVGSSKKELGELLSRIKDVGIENIVALRGDSPKGEEKFVPQKDGLAHANELVEFIHHHTDKTGDPTFGIAVGGYPETHIEAKDLESDLKNLKKKIVAGADVVITQLFYNNAVYFNFLEKARAIHIKTPLVPGLLPIRSTKQVKRITSLCGASIPPELLKELEAAGDNDAAATDIGVQHCIQQAKELLARGAPGLHFYVLNSVDHIQKIITGIGR